MSILLVVSRDRALSDQTRATLESSGWTVSSATDAAAALQMAARRPPRLVLVGPKVPGGDILLERFSRAKGGPGSLVAVPRGEVDSAAARPADVVLPIPFEPAELKEAVAGLVGRAAEDQALQEKLTAKDLFGDVLAEVEETALLEKRPRAKAPPRTDDQEEIDRRLEETLSGVLADAGAAPQGPASGARDGDDEVDRLLSESLSGLVVARKKARPAAPPPTSEAEAPRPAEEAEEEPEEEPRIHPLPPIEQVEEADLVATQRIATRSEAGAAEDGRRFGQYLLLERIAVGGMAEVWKARMEGVEGFRKTVAIKKILHHLTDSSDFVTMFIDEAKLAAQLNHNNITHIYDLGKIGDDYFIAMEYVEGKDLRTILNTARRRRRPLPTGLALLVASRLASALDYAHRKKDFEDRELGLVHRDVSPQNVLISYEGDIKLCDFGIVKAVSKTSKTQMGALKGKLQYMSPEQAWGRSVDGRSDIFSLGSLIYEMLTGRRLFAGDSEISVLESVRECQIIQPREVSSELSPELETVLLRALEREPEKRYQTAGELQQELERILHALHPTPGAADLAAYTRELFGPEVEKVEDGQQAAAEPIPVAPEAEPGPEPGGEAAEGGEIPAVAAVGVAPEETEGRRGRWLLLGGIAAALVAGVSTLVYLGGGGDLPVPSADRLEPTPVVALPVETEPAVDAPPTAEAVELETELVRPGVDVPESIPEEGAAGERLAALMEEELRRREAELRQRVELEQQRLREELERARQEEDRLADERREAELRAAQEAEEEARRRAEREAEERRAAEEEAARLEPEQAAPVAAPEEEPIEERPAVAEAESPAPPQEPEPAAPTVREGDLVELGAGVSPPVLVSFEAPDYPLMARRLRAQGVVVVGVLVDERGRVEETRLVEADRRNLGFNEAAEAAARSARFQPATKDGVRVKVWYTLRVPFRL